MNALGWGLLLAVLLAGWAALDGAVQGGVPLVRALGGREDARRRTVLATVAPFLLLGEVWLVAAAGVLLAAFGHVEATLWAAGYPFVVALLVAWVVRDAALWLRTHATPARAPNAAGSARLAAWPTTSHPRRHRGDGSRLRSQSAASRTTQATSNATTNGYPAAHSVPSTWPKAASSTPAAATSHTSPSRRKGATVASTVRRRASSRPPTVRTSGTPPWTAPSSAAHPASSAASSRPQPSAFIGRLRR